MTDADRYCSLDCIVTALSAAVAFLESIDPKNTDHDIGAEIDRLRDRIAEIERDRDGDPLDAMLAEQSRDEIVAREHYQMEVI